MGLTIHVDGGARGNPGPAGAGVVIRDEDGQLIYEAGYFLGRQTNNAAEYHALIRALERAGQCGAQPTVIHSDSELLVRQLTGEYQVKSPTLAPLHRQVQMLLIRMGHWSVRHVRREHNRRADELANLAMDAQRDVIVFDAARAADAAADSPPATDPSTSEAAEHSDGESIVTGATTTIPAVRVTLTRPPPTDVCPVGACAEPAFTIDTALPAGLCIHAAHALLPTLLGMLNTEPAEFAAIPTLTVRCGHPGCRAEFKLAPVRATNGQRRRAES